MATSSAACFKEAQQLRPKLCESCREVQLDDSAHGFKVRYKQSRPVRLEWEGGSSPELPTGFFLTDEFPKLPKLEDSSKQGCDLCGYLRDMISSKHAVEFAERHCGVSTTDSELMKVEVNIRFSWVLGIIFNGPSYLCANISFNDGCSGLVLWSSITAAAGSENLAKWLPIFTAQNGPPSDPHNIKWMKQQIHECKTDHSHTLPGERYAPERLLDVRGNPPKLISGSRLLSEASGKTPRYTALSYCWGTEEEATHQLTTTRESLSERQRGIHYNEAPPVLRDAISVTKSLNIPFLWIDALCILQGDNSDWEKQCPQMDNIYGHAEVTIVAASSNSCRDSFLHPKAPRTMLPFSLKQQPRIGGLFQVDFWGCTRAPSTRKGFNDVSDSQFGTRGWAMQERILSTRMIIFGTSNLQFICPDCSRGQQLNGPNYTISRVRTTDESLYLEWRRLLDEYRSITVESFTHPTDLLPALSGLAAYFGTRIKDRYCAGHWHKDLYQSLVWCSVKPRNFRDSRTRHISKACSPRPYIVPSWSRLGKGDSRALLNTYLRRQKQETLKLDAQISHTGENPFGAIRDAQLEVRTHTMCLRTGTNIELGRITPYSDTFWHPDCWNVSLVYRSKTGLSGRLGQDKDGLCCCVWVDYDLKDEDVRKDAEEWKWVLLGTEAERPFGLLLSSANDSKWCRVGVFVSLPCGEPSCRELELSDFTEFSSVETVMII